jgi:uncharacterized protein (TIGR02145 family)
VKAEFKTVLFALALCSALFLSCAEFSEIPYENRIEVVYGDKLYDIDNAEYKTVIIGTQTWMAENLKRRTADSECYNDKIEYCAKYGALYDWETAMSICPTGWHLPSTEEWETLTVHVGDPSIAGNRLKAASGWESFSEENSPEVLLSGNGIDRYGFSALPGGFLDEDNVFKYEGLVSLFWTSTASGANQAYSRMIFYRYDDIVKGVDKKNLLFSVRCIKDN